MAQNNIALNIALGFMLLIIGCILVFAIIGLINNLLNYEMERECFENIAEEYCQEQGYEFYEINSKEFECFGNRQIIGEFKFTERERETCFVWDWFPN